MRYFTTILVGLVCGWGVGAAIGFISFDSFDDDLGPWVLGAAIYFGTPIGIALAAAAAIVVALSSGARRSGHRLPGQGGGKKHGDT